MRISRDNRVIGKWLPAEIPALLADKTLLPTDQYYDEDVSDWLPLSDFKIKKISAEPEKIMKLPCYCGSGLPFPICCGNGGKY